MGARYRLQRRIQQRAKKALNGLKGSFVQGLDGNTYLGLEIPLITAFDWLEDGSVNAGHSRHHELFETLKESKGSIDVLPLPVSIEERVSKIRASEQPTQEQFADTVWQKLRQEEAERIAVMLSERPGGDTETMGLLFVSLGRRFEPSTITKGRFYGRPEADRFYLGNHADAYLLQPAESMLAKVAAVWPGSVPVRRQALDKALLQMISPGFTHLEPPIREEGISGSDDYVHEYFGRGDYTDCHPYEFMVDCYGRQRFVTCLPILPPAAREFEANNGFEYGFQAYQGQRVRFSYQFEVTGGLALATETGNSLHDVENHAQSHFDAGGHIEDMAHSIETSRALYRHVMDDKLVVQGRAMLVASAETEEELTVTREALHTSVRKSGASLVNDNQIQRQLLRAAFPGAKKFDRYIRTVGLKQAASAMPYVTSAPAMTGPDFFGITMGKEHQPVFGGLDAQLRLGATEAPVWCFHGPSRRGKTTAVVDWCIPLANRGGYIVHLFDLAKFDLKLLDASKLPPGTVVNFVNLMDHPGALNPVLLAGTDPDPIAMDEIRVAAMEIHLRKVCGQNWKNEWAPALRGACSFVLNEAYRANPGIPRAEVIPDLFKVKDRLYSREGKFAHEDELSACLATPLADRDGASISCSNNSVQALLDKLATPGIHVIQQQGFAIPDASLPRDQYEARHNLGMATLDLAGLLSYNVAMAREVRVAIAHIEFHVTSRLSKGANVAEFMARVGAALQTITIYDTQDGSNDIAQTLRDQITGWVGFAPNTKVGAANSLATMGHEATPKRIADFMGLTNRGWSSTLPPDGINKGGSFFTAPGSVRQIVALQNNRWYISEALETDQSARRKPASQSVDPAQNGRQPVSV